MDGELITEVYLVNHPTFGQVDRRKADRDVSITTHLGLPGTHMTNIWIPGIYNGERYSWFAPDRVRNTIVVSLLRLRHNQIRFIVDGATLTFNVRGFTEASQPVRNACNVSSTRGY